MIDRDHELPIVRQAQALGVARSSVYYKPRPVSAEDLKLMRRIDELHLEHPFAGARMLRDLLRREGVVVGRRHVATLMKRMGLAAIYRRPNASKPHAGAQDLPLSLARREDRAARSCLGDGHHVYPNASRLRLSHGGRRRGEPSRAGASRIDHDGGGVLRRGVERGAGEAWQAGDFQHGSRQPVTSIDFTSVLLDAKIAISMDGKGAWRDNVFVERLWRSVKYEEVYLHAYDSVSEARASITKYLAFYNEQPHIRALTPARQMRLTLIVEKQRWLHHRESPAFSKPRQLHLIFAGRCPNRRGQR